MRIHTFTVCIAALVTIGCNPRVFVDLENDAPTIAIEKPSGFGRNEFGATVAVADGQLTNGSTSVQIGVGAGADTPVFVFDGWNDDEIGRFRVLDDHCKRTTDCEQEAGAALVGVPAMAGEETCLVLGQPGANSLRFGCATAPAMTLVLGSGSRFGQALAPIPPSVSAGTALQLLIGAPGNAGAQGGLYYYVNDTTNIPIELAAAVSDTTVTPSDARLGAALATAELPAGFMGTAFDHPFLIAARAAGTGQVVLYLAGVEPGATAPVTPGNLRATVMACISPTGGAEGFGAALAAGDVVGADGVPEVYIGYDRGSAAHNDTVMQVDLADVVTAGMGAGCGRPTDPAAAPTMAITCPTVDANSESCDDSSFGSAIAIGDIDADGNSDLAVGAPGLRVNGKSLAGAVFAMSGGASGLDFTNAAFLRHSEPNSGDRLGSALAMMRSHINVPGVSERFEVVAGAPGANTAYVFLCSGLGPDVQATGPRCIEQPMTP